MVSFAREYRVVERIAELGIYRSRPQVETQSIPSKSWWSVPAQRCGFPLGVEHGGAKIDSIATMSAVTRQYYRKFRIAEAIHTTVFRILITNLLLSDNLKGTW